MKLDPSTWLTVPEAAAVADKGQSTVYLWVQLGRVKARLNTEGVIHVRLGDVLAAKDKVKRGRPRGVPTRR